VLWPAAVPGQSRIPRLNDGKPDMQGYWTNQTFTPLERPAQFKDKQFFTIEEAEAFAKRALDDVKDGAARREVKSDADIHYDDGIWLLEGYKKGAMLRTVDRHRPGRRTHPAAQPRRAEARAGARRGAERHRPVRQRAGARAVRALHLLGARRAAGPAHRLQLEPADRAGARHVRHPAGDDAGGARGAARQSARACRSHSRVSRRLARPLGRRHDGDRDDQLQREDGVARVVAEPQGDRAAHDDEPHDHPLPVHGGGPVDVDAAVERRVRDDAHRRPALRVRVHEGQLPAAVDPQGRAARRGRAKSTR
jgi:hypothetical protein